MSVQLVKRMGERTAVIRVADRDRLVTLAHRYLHIVPPFRPSKEEYGEMVRLLGGYDSAMRSEDLVIKRSHRGRGRSR